MLRESTSDTEGRRGGSALFGRDEVLTLMTDSRIPVDRRAFYATAFLTASRSGELSALRVPDYDRAARPLPRLKSTTSAESSVGSDACVDARHASYGSRNYFRHRRI